MDIKRLFMLSLIGIFLLTFFSQSVNAFEFDNVKNYNAETKTVDVRNSILGIPFLQLDQVADITLDTPLENYVGLGYQKVAQVTVNNYGQYSNALSKIDFYNIKRGMEKIDRQIDYKYLTLENVTYDVYGEDCKTILKNGSCSWGVVGQNSYEKEI